MIRKLFHRMIVLLHQIPFIDGDDHRLSPLMGNTGDFRILLRDSFLRINDENTDIRPLDRRNGTNNHKAFQLFLDLVLAPQSRRINKNIISPMILHGRIYGISGRSGDIGNNQSVCPDQFIDDRRLPHVRLSDDRNRNCILFFLFPRLFRKKSGDFL